MSGGVAAGTAVVAGTGASRISRFFLSLVFDEVYFGFGRRGWRRSRDRDLWLVFGPFDQYVDQSLLGVLWNLWDNWGGRSRWSRGLDEDDFVMFLWGSDLLNLLWGDVFLFWGWNVYVDVFLDDRGGRGVVVAAGKARTTSARIATGATSARVSGTDGSAGVSRANWATGISTYDWPTGVSTADWAAGVSRTATGVTAGTTEA